MPPLFRFLVSGFWFLLFCACAKPEPAGTHDALGRPTALPVRVERVVTLAPNLTEMVFAIGAGDLLVATDDASDFPDPAKRLPKVGAMEPNVEKIATLAPDLVLASTEGNPPSLAPALAAARVPLHVVRTDRLAEVAPAMRDLGGILGAPGADAAARDLEAAIAGQRRTRAKAPRLLFVVWTDPLYVAGAETFTADLFALCGALNAVTRRGWPQYPLELVAETPPELILYPRGAVTAEQMEALLARLPALRVPVVAVDEDIFQRPGPRVAEAAKVLNGILDGSGDVQH